MKFFPSTSAFWALFVASTFWPFLGKTTIGNTDDNEEPTTIGNTDDSEEPTIIKVRRSKTDRDPRLGCGMAEEQDDDTLMPAGSETEYHEAEEDLADDMPLPDETTDEEEPQDGIDETFSDQEDDEQDADETPMPDETDGKQELTDHASLEARLIERAIELFLEANDVQTYEEQSKEWWEMERWNQMEKREVNYKPAVDNDQPEEHHFALREYGRRRSVLYPTATPRGEYSFVKRGRKAVFKHPNGSKLKFYSCVPSINVEVSSLDSPTRTRKVAFCDDSPTIILVPSWNRFNRDDDMNEAFHHKDDDKHWKNARTQIKNDVELECLQNRAWQKYHFRNVVEKISKKARNTLEYRGVASKPVALEESSGSVTDCFGRRRSARISQIAQVKTPKVVYKRKAQPEKKEWGLITDENGRRRSARLQKK
jgi:hypothetical protein